MKTSLLRLGAVALLAAGSLNAQIHESIRQDVNTRPNVTIPEKLTADLFPEQPAVRPGASLKTGDLTQAIDWAQLWVTSTVFGPFWETYNDNPVFVYDAGTGMIGVVQIDLDGTFPNLTGIVNLIATMDNGANWSSTELFNRAGTLIGFPGFATANGGTSNLGDLFWTVFGWSYEQPDFNRTGSIGLFKTTGDPFDFPMLGPDFNNPQGYTWSLGDMVGVNGDAPSIHHVSRLGNPTGAQFGAYGQWGFDPDFEDFTASSMPQQWAVSQFVNPNDLTTTFNSSPVMGADEEGRLYMMVNNLFADDDQNRVPAVSISEDQGATWSDFSRMPVNALDAYRSQVGWANIAVYGPYQGDALVVTGPNEFSYFFRVRQINEAGNVINIDIVEGHYENGAWTLTRVAELNGFPLEFGRADEPSDAISEAAWLPSYALTSGGHEVGAAITADGSAIVVKWIDENPNRGYIKFDQTLTAYFNSQGNWQPNEFDSLLTTDVYMAYRMLDGTWSTPVNHTDDLAYDKGTRIPRVVPNLSNVPVLSLGTFPLDQFNPQYSFYQALSQLPALVFDANVDRRAPKVVQVGFFNAINPTSVNEDVVNYTFNLNAVAPNPAQNEAEVTFTMDVPGTVSLDLYSTTGSKVATVFNGHLSAGVHGLMVDASSIATGTYYVALTVNGQRLTQPLAIVK